MAQNPIHFGTSGWRGIIAEEFTFANVRVACAAIAHYLLQQAGKPVVVVGYDTRFLSERFAETAAVVLASHGLEVHSTSRPHPTPTLSYEIRNRGLQGGINFTASHNPAEYNGLKFSSADGAPALPEVTRQIEALAERVLAGDYSAQGPMFSAALRKMTDPRPAYLQAIRAKVNLKAIGEAKLKVACDPLYGTARGYLDDLLRETGVELKVIHDYRDVLFSGVGPEPSQKNLEELSGVVAQGGFSVGLSTDGDADRFGIVDADGTWIHPNYILGILADYLMDVRKVEGGLARSVATTHLLDAVARHHKAPLYQTPVGFKYIGELLNQDKIVLGGEESAGLTIRGHLPEKDGILACLLVAEAVARRGQSVKQQIQELFRKVGSYYSERINLKLDASAQKRLVQKLKADPAQFEGRAIARIDRTDGLKMVMAEDRWVLLRLSGTEPVVRVYCEAPSLEELGELVESAKKFALNP